MALSRRATGWTTTATRWLIILWVILSFAVLGSGIAVLISGAAQTAPQCVCR